jgi:hypothetical protein
VKCEAYLTGHRQFRVEPCADLEERSDAASDPYLAAGGLGDAVEDFQEGALPGAIAPDDAKHLARLDIEGDIAQGPEIRGACWRCGG